MDSPLMADGKPWPEHAVRMETVEGLHKTMLSLWGKQYIDKWVAVPTDQMFRTWGIGLHGLTEIEFRRGVTKLKEMDRPPGLPEFLKACRPEVNPVSAYYEALEGLRSRERGEVGTWSHPAIFWAAVRVSSFELLNQTYSQIRGRWEAALAAELQKGHWDPIGVPFKALPPPSNDGKSREQAAKMMQQLKERAGTPPPHNDDKRWARKILERQKNGDKTLLPIQVDFARRALQVTKDDDDD